MDQQSIKTKTISGIIWQFCQKSFGQLFHFVITVILARLLAPEDYGVVALASMFNVLVGIFINGSMDVALVQKKNADDLDFNTVFFSSLFMSFVIYAVVYFGAPYFASLYNNSQITPIMRVLALTMPISAFTMVQNAMLSRQMAFKKFFYVSLPGMIIAAIIAIIMAYQGFGAWALVAQTLVNSIIGAIVLFSILGWRPKFVFSWERFKGLFSYAWKRTVAGFLGTFCNQLKGYLIGYHYTTADLAYYNRGEGLPEMLKNNLSGTIDGVMLPALSKIQDDITSVKRGLRRSILTSTFFVCPILFGLASTADNIVPILYSAKWNPAIPFMQIACATFIVVLINNTNLQTLYALGRTDIVLKQEFIKKPVMLVFLSIAITISPIAISIAIFFHSIHELFWTSYANSKLINYSLLEQLSDVKANILTAFAMAVVVYIVGSSITNPYLSLSVQIPVGIIIYVGLSHILNLESYKYIKEILWARIKK